MKFLRGKRIMITIGVMAVAALSIMATVAATPGDPRELSEGADLLDQASITVEQALATAEAHTPGEVKEIELEREHGTLIFEVEIGNVEVIIDATTGAVLGTEDESHETEDDDDHDEGDDDHDEQEDDD